MKAIFFILFLFVFIVIPQQGFADLNPPSNLMLDPNAAIGQRSARVLWDWDSGEEGNLSKFIIDGGMKRDSLGATVTDCGSIGDWFEIHEEPGQSLRAKTIRGLDRGETYCWRVMAQAQDTDNNSVVVLGPEFTTALGGNTGPVCGANGCETGEDAISCPQDCSVVGSSGVPVQLENPISASC